MSHLKHFGEDCQRARSHIVDSRFYCKGYSSGESRQIFCDKYRMQRWLEVEACLSLTQAELGIIPQPAADEIARNAHLHFLGLHSIQEGIQKTSHSLMPLLWALQKVCKSEYGEFIHFGATTQDIQDTAQVLEIRDAIYIMERDLILIVFRLIELADKYKNFLFIGRTHCQHALPMTLGLKFAVWLDEVFRHLDRLRECRNRILVSELFGGVGTMDAFGPKGIQVLEIFSKKLGLSAANVAWHASRDRFAEFLALMASITGTLAKIADEIRGLARSEFGEFEEPFHMGKLGSSTMPHKRNPEMCEQVVVLARLTRANASLGFEGIINEHERDYRSVRLEWVTITGSCLFTCGALSLVREILSGMVIHEKRIASNVKKAASFIGTEALMFALGKKIGKQTAHQIIYESSQQALDQERPLFEILQEHPVASTHLSLSEIEQATDPAQHVGLSAELTDRAINLLKEKLQPSDYLEPRYRVCPLMDPDGKCSVPQIV